MPSAAAVNAAPAALVSSDSSDGPAARATTPTDSHESLPLQLSRLVATGDTRGAVAACIGAMVAAWGAPVAAAADSIGALPRLVGSGGAGRVGGAAADLPAAPAGRLWPPASAPPGAAAAAAADLAALFRAPEQRVDAATVRALLQSCIDGGLWADGAQLVASFCTAACASAAARGELVVLPPVSSAAAARPRACGEGAATASPATAPPSLAAATSRVALLPLPAFSVLAHFARACREAAQQPPQQTRAPLVLGASAPHVVALSGALWRQMQADCGAAPPPSAAAPVRCDVAESTLLLYDLLVRALLSRGIAPLPAAMRAASAAETAALLPRRRGGEAAACAGAPSFAPPRALSRSAAALLPVLLGHLRDASARSAAPPPPPQLRSSLLLNHDSSAHLRAAERGSERSDDLCERASVVGGAVRREESCAEAPLVPIVVRHPLADAPPWARATSLLHAVLAAAGGPGGSSRAAAAVRSASGAVTDVDPSAARLAALAWRALHWEVARLVEVTTRELLRAAPRGSSTPSPTPPAAVARGGGGDSGGRAAAIAALSLVKAAAGGSGGALRVRLAAPQLLMLLHAYALLDTPQLAVEAFEELYWPAFRAGVGASASAEGEGAALGRHGAGGGAAEAKATVAASGASAARAVTLRGALLLCPSLPTHSLGLATPPPRARGIPSLRLRADGAAIAAHAELCRRAPRAPLAGVEADADAAADAARQLHCALLAAVLRAYSRILRYRWQEQAAGTRGLLPRCADAAEGSAGSCSAALSATVSARVSLLLRELRATTPFALADAVTNATATFILTAAQRAPVQLAAGATERGAFPSAAAVAPSPLLAAVETAALLLGERASVDALESGEGARAAAALALRAVSLGAGGGGEGTGALALAGVSSAAAASLAIVRAVAALATAGHTVSARTLTTALRSALVAASYRAPSLPPRAIALMQPYAASAAPPPATAPRLAAPQLSAAAPHAPLLRALTRGLLQAAGWRCVPSAAAARAWQDYLAALARATAGVDGAALGAAGAADAPNDWLRPAATLAFGEERGASAARSLTPAAGLTPDAAAASLSADAPTRCAADINDIRAAGGGGAALWLPPQALAFLPITAQSGADASLLAAAAFSPPSLTADPLALIYASRALLTLGEAPAARLVASALLLHFGAAGALSEADAVSSGGAALAAARRRQFAVLFPRAPGGGDHLSDASRGSSGGPSSLRLPPPPPFSRGAPPLGAAVLHSAAPLSRSSSGGALLPSPPAQREKELREKAALASDAAAGAAGAQLPDLGPAPAPLSRVLAPLLSLLLDASGPEAAFDALAPLLLLRSERCAEGEARGREGEGAASLVPPLRATAAALALDAAGYIAWARLAAAVTARGRRPAALPYALALHASLAAGEAGERGRAAPPPPAAARRIVWSEAAFAAAAGGLWAALPRALAAASTAPPAAPERPGAGARGAARESPPPPRSPPALAPLSAAEGVEGMRNDAVSPPPPPLHALCLPSAAAALLAHQLRLGLAPGAASAPPLFAVLLAEPALPPPAGAGAGAGVGAGGRGAALLLAAAGAAGDAGGAASAEESLALYARGSGEGSRAASARTRTPRGVVGWGASAHADSDSLAARWPPQPLSTVAASAAALLLRREWRAQLEALARACAGGAVEAAAAALRADAERGSSVGPRAPPGAASLPLRASQREAPLPALSASLAPLASAGWGVEEEGAEAGALAGAMEVYAAFVERLLRPLRLESRQSRGGVRRRLLRAPLIAAPPPVYAALDAPPPSSAPPPQIPAPATNRLG